MILFFLHECREEGMAWLMKTHVAAACLSMSLFNEGQACNGPEESEK